MVHLKVLFLNFTQNLYSHVEYLKFKKEASQLRLITYRIDWFNDKISKQYPKKTFFKEEKIMLSFIQPLFKFKKYLYIS